MNYFSHLLIIVLFFSCSLATNSVEEAHSEDYAFVGQFTQGLEGPAVDKNGNLFFVNPTKNGTIGKINAETKKLEIIVDSLPNGSIANGIRINTEGQLLLADYVNHTIFSLDAASNELKVFATDASLNQPNDIAIMRNGMLITSDPNWAESTGNIWRIDTNRTVNLLESNMGTTNGIEVSPGDSILYVNESVQRKIWAYTLSASGNITNKRLLIEFKEHGLDGMRCDVKGNLYVARYGKGVIAVISPQGELLYEVKLKAQKPTNVAFGGSEGKTVYITCQDRGYIEMFEAEYPGRSFELNK